MHLAGWNVIEGEHDLVVDHAHDLVYDLARDGWRCRACALFLSRELLGNEM